MLSLSRFFKHKKAQKRIKQAIENYQPKEYKPTAYFYTPEMKNILKAIQFSDVKELIVKTGLNNTTYSKTTYRNIKKAIVILFED